MGLSVSKIRTYIGPEGLIVAPRSWTRTETADHFETHADRLRLVGMLDRIPRGVKFVTVRELVDLWCADHDLDDLPIVII